MSLTKTTHQLRTSRVRAMTRKLRSPISQEWMQQYHHERGVDADTASVNAVWLADPADNKRAGFKEREGIRYPNRHPITNELLESGQVRYREPIMRHGKPQKFDARPGISADPYFATASFDWPRLFRTTSVPLVFSEGPTRALAGASQAIPVVALRGVACHGVGDDLHPTLKLIKLKNRKVYIVYDADAVGNFKVAAEEKKLAKKLMARGAKVYIVRIPSFIPKAGLDDLLALPGGKAMFELLCAASEAIDIQQSNHATPTLQSAADIESKATQWLSNPRLPLGMLAGMEGEPGGGKTANALALAADGSCGRDALTGNKIEPYSTVYWSYENPANVVKARLMAMGANLKRIHLLLGAKNADGTERTLTIASIPELRAALQKTKAKLFIIDPLQSVMGAGVDSHKANETRPLLDALARLADELGVCILIIRHQAKSGGGRIGTRGLGSIDITGALRSNLIVGTAPDDQTKRALFHTKSNVGPMAEPLGFFIEGKGDACIVRWTGPTDLTLADIVAPEGAKRRTQVDEAMEFLRDELAEGPMEQKVLAEKLKELSGIGATTLHKASARLDVKKSRPGGKDAAWVWALRETTAQRKFTKGGA